MLCEESSVETKTARSHVCNEKGMWGTQPRRSQKVSMRCSGVQVFAAQADEMGVGDHAHIGGTMEGWQGCARCLGTGRWEDAA